MFLNNDVKDVLRKYGVDKLLPMVDVFNADIAGKGHLSSACSVDYIPTQSQHFLDLNVYDQCFTCMKTPARQFVYALSVTLSGLGFNLEELAEAEHSLQRISEGKTPEDVSALGFALYFVRHEFKAHLETLADNEYLHLLKDQFEDQMVTIDQKIVAYLKSDEGHTDIALFCRGNNIISSTYNHLLVNDDGINGLTLAIAEGYGKKVAPGRFLVAAPGVILSRLAINSVSAGVYIEEGTPQNVVETMAILWDPYAVSAFGDPRNALIAARELTPKTC